MKVGDPVYYLDEGEEIPARVEFVLPPACDPEANPNYDLSEFDCTLIGGGVRDEESYLISIPNPNYRPGRDRKKRSLLWPRLIHIAVPIATAPKPKKTYNNKSKSKSL